MQGIEVKGVILQLFPLVQDQIGVTSTDGVDSDGVFVGAKAIDCKAAGGIKITYPTGAPVAVVFAEDDRYGVPEAIKLEITSGTFNLA